METFFAMWLKLVPFTVMAGAFCCWIVRRSIDIAIEQDDAASVRVYAAIVLWSALYMALASVLLAAYDPEPWHKRLLLATVACVGAMFCAFDTRDLFAVAAGIARRRDMRALHGITRAESRGGTPSGQDGKPEDARDDQDGDDHDG